VIRFDRFVPRSGYSWSFHCERVRSEVIGDDYIYILADILPDETSERSSFYILGLEHSQFSVSLPNPYDDLLFGVAPLYILAVWERDRQRRFRPSQRFHQALVSRFQDGKATATANATTTANATAAANSEGNCGNGSAATATETATATAQLRLRSATCPGICGTFRRTWRALSRRRRCWFGG
jgi:hypothetical protein